MHLNIETGAFEADPGDADYGGHLDIQTGTFDGAQGRIDQQNVYNQMLARALLPDEHRFSPEQMAAFLNPGPGQNINPFARPADSQEQPNGTASMIDPSTGQIGAMWSEPAKYTIPSEPSSSFLDSQVPWSSQSRNDQQSMAPGLSIMALPFAAAAIGGGTLAGEGAAGAEGGAAGAGATGVQSGGGGTLLADSGQTMTDVGPGIGGTTTDTAGGTMGDGWSFDDFSGQWVQDPSPMPESSGFSGDPGNMDANGNRVDVPFGGSSSDSPGLLQQAQNLAKQLGITPASALGFLKSGIGALGRAAPAALGALGANQQASSLSALADKYMALGAPSRARYESSFAPGFTMANDPGYQDALDASSKATLHGLSTQGNPAGSPNAWAQSLQDNYAKTAYPALQNYRNTNANAGGIASLQTAAPGAATSAIGAQSNVFNAIGGGLNDIFNPQPSLAQTLAQYQQLLKQGSGAVM